MASPYSMACTLMSPLTSMWDLRMLSGWWLCSFSSVPARPAPVSESPRESRDPAMSPVSLPAWSSPTRMPSMFCSHHVQSLSVLSFDSVSERRWETVTHPSVAARSTSALSHLGVVTVVTMSFASRLKGVFDVLSHLQALHW